MLRPPVGNDPPGDPCERPCLDILWISVRHGVWFVHEADAFEVGSRNAYTCAVGIEPAAESLEVREM